MKRLLGIIAIAVLLPVCGAVMPASASSPFTTVCGNNLCNNGRTYVIKGGTAYGLYGSPATAINLAKQAGINTLELVEFDCNYHQLADTESACTWNRLDTFIGAAQKAGLHVILNVSEFGQSLQAAGKSMANPTDYFDRWAQYLTWIATRTNTATGVRYMNDPTIAKVEIWGEAPNPNGVGEKPIGTAAQTQLFFHAAELWWHIVVRNILISSGGFSHVNDGGWPMTTLAAIVADPNNATCDVEVNSYGDRDVTVPTFTKYCSAFAKPWFLSAWSSCKAPSSGAWDIDHYPTGDPAMAAHAMNMYAVAAGGTPATSPSVGTDFWNIGTAASGCTLGPQFPQTWAVVHAAP